ncbi:MAG: hypothetical protein ACO1TE_28950 [Prosthecobacter sp.]
MNKESKSLIITGSFDGLLDRVARIPFFDVWLDLKARIKCFKKQKMVPTIPVSEVCALTGLTEGDTRFLVSLQLIALSAKSEDSLLAAQDVLALMKVLERIVEDLVLPAGSDT